MMKAMLAIFFVTTFLAISEAQNYGELPIPVTTSAKVELETSSLQPLFDMAENFVNLVFVPFSALTEIFIQVIRGDPLSYVQQNWQQFLTAQAGLIACLVFGILFIVLTVLGGLMMCCCRCCCQKCGGRMKQSKKRAKSKWRTFHCIGLLLCTVLIFVPGTLVLLTNQWVGTLVGVLPTQASNVLQNGVTYVDSVNEQLQYLLTQFDVFAATMRSEVANVSTTLGTSIIDGAVAIHQPVVNKLSVLGQRVVTLRNALNSYETQRALAVVNYNNFSSEVAEIRNDALAMISDSGCTSHPNCLAALNTISGLGTGDDLSTTLPDESALLTQLDTTYIPTCGALYTSASGAARQIITDSVNNAITPTFVNDLTTDVDTQLTSARTTLQDTIDNLDILNQVRSFIANAQNSVDSFLKAYKDSYDFYRWIAGIILGAFIIFISALYFIGSFFGYCCGSPSALPSERSSFSNFNGILVMSGVGLSFIFAWLFMILVMVAFIAGGVMERYICQTTQSPYELLQFVDTHNPVNFTSGTTAINSNLQSVVTSCSNNAGLLQTFGVTNLVNFTEINQSIDEALQVTDINLSVALSSNPLDRNAFETCFNMILPLNDITINPTPSIPDYTTDISELRRLAPIVPAAYTSAITNAADDLESVQILAVQAASSALTSLLAQPSIFNTEAAEIRTLKGEIPAEIDQANADVSTQMPTIVTQAITRFVSTTQGHGNTFFDWFQTQVITRLGACLPLYQVYDDLLTLICDYLVATLNGFWFALGWAVFFMSPAAIFAMKLAKFFRRMDKNPASATPPPNGVELVGLQEVSTKVQQQKTTLKNRLPPIQKTVAATKKATKNNKVAPSMNF